MVGGLNVALMGVDDTGRASAGEVGRLFGDVVIPRVGKSRRHTLAPSGVFRGNDRENLGCRSDLQSTSGRGS
jgi:hypothetical protein